MVTQWQTDVAMTGSETEYKYVVRLPGGDTLWEQGFNRRAQAEAGAIDEWRSGWADALATSAPSATVPPAPPPPSSLPPPPPPPRPQQQPQQQAASAPHHRGDDDAGDGHLPRWYREAVVYHVQSLGFFGVEGEMNDGMSAPTSRLDKMRDWCASPPFLRMSHPRVSLTVLAEGGTVFEVRFGEVLTPSPVVREPLLDVATSPNRL
jgi:hypothetical protein